MDKIDAMKLFLRVAEAGSFSKAARQMGIVQSTTSKQIAALERRLGTQLVRRTSRGLALTAAGQHYYDNARRLVDEFELLEDAVSERERSPGGLVRLTCPPGFATSYLLPQLGPFVERYPSLSLEFVVSQRIVDLVEEHIDVAIRVGDLEDSELRSRQVGTTAAIVVASAEYLRRHGEPTTPAELEGHPCIASIRHGKPRPWRFRRAGDRVTIDPKGPIQSDDVELTRAAVKSGLGIAHAASWLFRDELISGAVRQILTDYECIQVPISAVWSGDRALPRRAAVFIDYLEAVCAAEPTLCIR
ncbi:MAG: LysR family transcriptional regulator [Azospirillaceae bacterium]|nr:LysR family transcriptional regulator [Azospirillaceae bacterium]